MSRLLVVFGATGNQGSSIINFVLNDAELSKQFKIRGTTRDVTKPVPQRLAAKGVEMVKMNVDDASSVRSALEGVHTVFYMTTGDYSTSTKAYELNQGKVIADVAVASSAQYIIFSTLPNVTKNSQGKYTHVWPFDVKAEIEDHIRGLPVKSAFFAPGSFMQNFQSVYKPRKQDDGTYVIPSIEPSDSKHMPLIDIDDTGKFVGAILSDPDSYEGKVLYGANGLSSWNEITDIVSCVTGMTVRHKVLPEAVFRGFMNQARGDELCDMMNNRTNCGYYGPDQLNHIEWSKQQAKGRLNTLEEYLKEHPIEFPS